MEVIAKVKQEQSDHHKESLDVNHDNDVNMEVDKETDSNSCDNLGSSLVESDRKIKEENVKEEPDLSNSCNSVDNLVVESDRKIKEENIKKEEPDLCNSNNDMNNSIVESDSKEENNVKREEPDLYSYTKLDDFTSEIFKIELGNLPNFIGYGQLRKLLNSNLKLHPRKVKAIGNPPHFAFITFRNEKDRDKALKELNGYQWKGKTLSAKKANPAADPMAKKRKAGESEDCSDPKKAKTEEPIELKLKNAVTPYWNIPYEEQLKMKEDEIHKFLQKLSKSIEKVNSSLKPILSKYRKENYYQCCPLQPIKRSPVTTAYRNKCEFTVGRHLYTKEKTVGFRLNSYKEGSMSVAEPDDCINISESMLKAVKSFQAYIRESDKDVYNPENHAGYWRQLTVRTSNNADVLIIIVMHPQSLSE
ncbi:tRNA (uracil-5-)-methyltransferase A, partial [Araneus ventricosus]